jgi:hypothetical protein
MRRRIESRSGAVCFCIDQEISAMAAATPAVTAASATVEASTTAAMECAALMPDLAASVVELRMMSLVVMPFPIVVNVEVGMIAVAIAPSV